MFVSFNDAFGRKKHDIKVPEEIIAFLSEQLPENFQYTSTKHGALVLMPDEKTEMKMKIAIKVAVPDQELKTSNDLMEYLYRTQQEVPVEGEKITINGYEFKVSDLVKFPLSSQEPIFSRFLLSPEPFQPPFPIKIGGGGVFKEIIVQRKPYADMNKSLFESVEDCAFTISYIIDEKEHSLKIDFNIDIKKSKSIKDIVESLILFASAQKGEMNLFGNEMVLPSSEIIDEGFNETIKFWEKIIMIEDRLKVKFSPEIPVSNEDALWFEKLYRSFVEEKPHKEYVKLTKFSVTEPEGFEELKTKSELGLSLTFINEYDLTLMGVTISIYDATALFNLSVKDIVPTDSKSNIFDVFVEPSNDEGIYQASRAFTSSASAHDYLLLSEELKKAELIKL